ncbi:MAG TPA: FtsX-like permease family protein [Streptosporangiaceae bacterium]|nr:FtsX-like permease family protein [Streptosporangiaceae bacterium]
MSTLSIERPVAAEVADGGIPARRAVIHWAWRLFRREWRQQLLMLGLLTIAVAATVWGAGVATNTPPASPSAGTFGTASALVTLPGTDPTLTTDIRSVTSKYGPAEVIENQNLSTGLTEPVQLRAQDPHGRYGGPMLSLVSGQYPDGPGQVALTSQVASAFDTGTGGSWHADGQTWRVTGIVQNPANLLDEFALVAPGQVTAPSQVSILLGPAAVPQNENQGPDQNPTLPSLPKAATISYPTGASAGIPPATIVLVVAVLGLVFIGLVSVAGFTVMAQRRLRALGMLAALGATERNVRLVMVANGAVLGVVGALLGAIAGFAAWFAYVPTLQTDTGHVINRTNLPWWAIAVAIVLAIGTAVLAARRPARTMARIPVVAALSGRPAPPKAVHRSVIPGAVLIAVGVVALFFSGGWAGNSGSDALTLLVGLVTIIIGVCLLAPLCVALLAFGAGPRMPVAVRIALRDLMRQRARSGAALGAVTFAVFLAVLISIVASIRFEKVLDWTGANLSSQELIVYTQNQGPNAGPNAPLTAGQLTALQTSVDSYARTLHATSVLPLEIAGPTLYQLGTQNNNFSGRVYVATPALLHQYGINPSSIQPGTDIVSMRPGLSGLPNMIMIWGPYLNPDNGPPPACTVANGCVANPKIQEVASLPSGTSAPNTVVTEQALRKYHLQTSLNGWLIEAPHALTSENINQARQIAIAAGVSVETKSGELGLTQISDGATVLGLVIALGVLVMTVGLIRSESMRDLRTLTATGAGGTTRRTITGATAGALGLLGAVLGTLAAAIAGVAWARSSLSVTFGDVPAADLIAILIGLPVVAALGGWLLGGRQPAVISRQPLE